MVSSMWCMPSIVESFGLRLPTDLVLASRSVAKARDIDDALDNTSGCHTLASHWLKV